MSKQFLQPVSQFYDDTQYVHLVVIVDQTFSITVEILDVTPQVVMHRQSPVELDGAAVPLFQRNAEKQAVIPVAIVGPLELEVAKVTPNVRIIIRNQAARTSADSLDQLKRRSGQG